MPSSIVLTAIFGDMILAGAALGSAGVAAAAFAINIVASAIISKAFAPNINTGSDNPGNRAQVPPAGDNKLPVIYGSAYVGGVITDLSITSNNQNLYYVLSLAEVTNTETGGTPDTFTFGDIYFGGKRCIFDGSDLTKVVALLDESTGVQETNVNGNLFMYLYRNGSSSGVNTSLTAIQVMQDSSLTYQWDSTKLMSNCAFAIVKITYNAEANLTGIQQTKFKLTNSRFAPGDCFFDYLTSTRYGAAIPVAGVDVGSLSALNTYSAGAYTYTPSGGGTATQARFTFNGVIDPNQSIMSNLQAMAACCDCLLKYNEITGLWGVIVQSPSYSYAMDLNDSNIISAIQVTPLDMVSSYNIAEVKFPDGTDNDSFNTATYNLAVLNPSLMYPNEPVNKQSISLPLVNNSVQAQYLANRFLEGGREDLQVKLTINYSGFQLEAGDLVTITNTNYGWAAKVFRVSQVIENFEQGGQLTTSLTLMEYNPAIYDDIPITQFTPSPNTGIGSPLTFGTLYTPSVTNIQTSSPVPSFDVAVTASSNGIVQYAEVYYSAFSLPTEQQRFFVGTTAINSAGNPYDPSSSMGVVTVTNLPQGDWHFSVKYVNSLGASGFSGSSSVLNWRPLTFQYENRYLAIAYADNATGTSGFSYSPRNKAYFGLYNNVSANGGTDPTLYKWYLSPVNFGTSTDNFLLYANRSNRKFSFNVGNAGYVNLGGAFVPTETSVYDSTVWSGLIDPAGGVQSFIDLDKSTGQVIVNGYSSQNQNDGFLSITNNTDGQMRVNLQQFLNFGAGIYTKSFDVAKLTVDVYGRVVGFLEQDQFFYTETVYTATAAQTTFSNTHTVGWILVFRNGVLLDTTEYSETSTTVVMANACAAGEVIVIFYMRGVSTSASYVQTNMTIASSTTNTITYSNAPWQIVNVGDKMTFTDVVLPSPPTQYTVQSINTTTKVITFTTTIAGATAGNQVFIARAAGSSYAPFSRYKVALTAATTYTPTTWAIQNGAESIYVNGAQINEIDYNISGLAIDGFPAPLTGNMTIILFAPNNLNVPASNVVNVTAYSTAGQTTYPFTSNPLSLEIFANGALLAQGASYDYTASSANYILTTAYNNNSTLLNQQTFARDGAA
jgi:hypothetical protein